LAKGNPESRRSQEKACLGALKDADRVLEARLYAYQRGGATLLEFIDAQRTSAEVYLAYSQTLADHAKALVNLELVSAIWDVTF